MFHWSVGQAHIIYKYYPIKEQVSTSAVSGRHSWGMILGTEVFRKVEGGCEWGNSSTTEL